MRTRIATALLVVALIAPSWAIGVSFGPWQWSYDAGYVMVRGTMKNNSGLTLPITIYAMEDKKELYQYQMTVNTTDSTDFSFMFRLDKKPSSLKLEWGARNGSGY